MGLTFGESIKKRRIEKGLTQEEMARNFKVSQTYWSLIERDISKPFKLCYQICKELEISFKYLDVMK